MSVAELGAAMTGAVGLNPTRRGEHLAADIELADCQLIVTESRFEASLAEALRGGEAPRARVLDVERDAPVLLAAQSEVDPRVPRQSGPVGRVVGPSRT